MTSLFASITFFMLLGLYSSVIPMALEQHHYVQKSSTTFECAKQFLKLVDRHPNRSNFLLKLKNNISTLKCTSQQKTYLIKKSRQKLEMGEKFWTLNLRSDDGRYALEIDLKINYPLDFIVLAIREPQALN